MLNKLFVLGIILSVCFFSNISAKDDYKFTITENTIKKLIAENKDAFKEASLHDVEFKILDNKRFQIKLDYKNIVPATIELYLKAYKTNEFDIIFKKYEIIGFLDLSKKSLAKKIKKAIDDSLIKLSKEKKDPKYKNWIKTQVIDNGNIILRLKLDPNMASTDLKDKIKVMIALKHIYIDGKKIILSGAVLFKGANITNGGYSDYTPQVDDTTSDSSSSNTSSVNNTNYDFSKGQIGYVTSKQLYLRKGPASSYSPVEELKIMDKDTKVVLLEETNGWAKVKVNGIIGYCSLKYIHITKDIDSEYKAKIGYVNTTMLYLRKGPSSKYPPVSEYQMMPKNTKIEVLNKEADGWAKIKVIHNKVIGYCSLKYISY